MSAGISWRRPMGLVAVAAAAALIVGLFAVHHNPQTSTAVDSPTTTRLPTGGSKQADTVGSGWTHDAPGAVEAAVAITQTQIGFDVDQAVTVAATYADLDDQAALEALARTAVAARREQAGVSDKQDPPAPSSYAASPLAYTVHQVGPDQYAVHLLSWITLTSTTAQVKDHLYVGTMLLTWSDTWRVTMPTYQQLEVFADQQPPAATPGSGAFASAGWILIDENDR